MASVWIAPAQGFLCGIYINGCGIRGSYLKYLADNKVRERRPKVPLALVQSSFGLAGIKLWSNAMLNLSPIPKKVRKGKCFCHLYKVKDKPANRLF